MSDQLNDNHPGCCVCLDPTEIKTETPCNHPEPICEPYPGVAPIEFSDDEPEALVSAAWSGHEALVRLLLDRGLQATTGLCDMQLLGAMSLL